MILSESKTALLFPGQGLPLEPDHIRSFYEHDPGVRELLDGISYDFGSQKNIRELCLEGGPELNDTRYAQASIFLASVAIAETLKRLGVQPDVVAGLSLGEYSALGFAGSFNIQEGLRLLGERGRIMAEEIPKNSSMVSILGLEAGQVQTYCDEASMLGACEIATYSTNQRIVITGNTNAVNQAKRRCEEHERVRTVSLGTSRAFHSSLAKPAADKFAIILDEMNFTFNSPNIPLYFNVDGKKNHSDIADVEVAQFYRPVQLEETFKNMYKDGVRQLIAIGPGVSMAGYSREVAKDQNVQIDTYTVETYDDVIKLLEKWM